MRAAISEFAVKRLEVTWSHCCSAGWWLEGELEMEKERTVTNWTRPAPLPGLSSPLTNMTFRAASLLPPKSHATLLLADPNPEPYREGGFWDLGFLE